MPLALCAVYLQGRFNEGRGLQWRVTTFTVASPERIIVENSFFENLALNRGFVLVARRAPRTASRTVS
jgi:hypothetical protein